MCLPFLSELNMLGSWELSNLLNHIYHCCSDAWNWLSCNFLQPWASATWWFEVRRAASEMSYVVNFTKESISSIIFLLSSSWTLVADCPHGHNKNVDVSCLSCSSLYALRLSTGGNSTCLLGILSFEIPTSIPVSYINITGHLLWWEKDRTTQTWRSLFAVRIPYSMKISENFPELSTRTISTGT